MDLLFLITLSLVVGSVSGIAFVVYKIIEEEKEKKEKLAFVKAFSAKHGKNKQLLKGCPHCGCTPCHCGS